MSRNSDMKAQVILIVEDQPVMRAMLREFLGNAFPGWSILAAADGAQAMTLAAEFRPSLVLMDVRLPDANGIELTARMRQLLPDTKVIVVSYLSTPVDIEQARSAGAFAYVAKDHLLTELIPAVRLALDAGSPE